MRMRYTDIRNMLSGAKLAKFDRIMKEYDDISLKVINLCDIPHSDGRDRLTFRETLRVVYYNTRLAKLSAERRVLEDEADKYR